MGKTFRQQFAETYRSTRAEQREKQMQKKREKEKEGPLAVRIHNGFIRWGKRLFYTAFMGMAMYLIIMIFTLMLPMVLATIIGAMGYTLANMAELILTGFCGMFFTLWMFVISFFIVRYFGRIYMKAMKATGKKTEE